METDPIVLGVGHLTIIVGTGYGAFVNKNCPLGRAFDNVFICLGFAREFACDGMHKV